MIELIIAITVAGVIMGLAIPRLRPAQDGAGVRSARQVVQTYLVTARQMAIRRGSPVTFHLSGNEVRVTTNGGATAVERRVDLRDAYSVDVTSTLTTVTFNGRGIATPRLGTSTSIVLARGSTRDSLCVAVLGSIGRCGL